MWSFSTAWIVNTSIRLLIVAEKGFDPQFGARPLHRAIQKYIEDPLAEFILNENPVEGSHLVADLNVETQELVITQTIMEKENT